MLCTGPFASEKQAAVPFNAFFQEVRRLFAQLGNKQFTFAQTGGTNTLLLTTLANDPFDGILYRQDGVYLMLLDRTASTQQFHNVFIPADAAFVQVFPELGVLYASWEDSGKLYSVMITLLGKDAKFETNLPLVPAGV